MPDRRLRLRPNPHVLNSGLMAAIEPAMIPKDGSMTDQAARLTVSKRKSADIAILLTYGMRMNKAIPALAFVSDCGLDGL